MLKQQGLSILILFFLVATFFTGCTWFSPMKITINSLSVIDDEGFCSLSLDFNTSHQITAFLFNPSNEQLLEEVFNPHHHTISIPLVDYRSMPDPGTYTFQCKNALENVVFEQTFTLTTPQIIMQSSEFFWFNQGEDASLFSLISVSSFVYNAGSHPLYIDTMKISTETVTQTSLVLPTVIQPGNSKEIHTACYLPSFPFTEQQIQITLYDRNNRVLVSEEYQETPVENIAFDYITWRSSGKYTAAFPELSWLTSYYQDQERPILEDYTVYLTDPYDDLYLTMVKDVILSTIGDSIGDEEQSRINGLSAFVQQFQYKEDEDGDELCEYPKFPLELIEDKEGDCEDKAILTAALLDLASYNVSLIRLPKHMAVGVILEDPSGFEPYIDGYYFLEATRPNWIVGKIPDEYQDETNITVYPVDNHPIITHSWKQAVSYSMEKDDDYVKITVIVKNLGGSTDSNLRMHAGFIPVGSSQWLQEQQIALDDVPPNSAQQYRFRLIIPEGYTTNLKTRIFQDSLMIDEKESSSTFY